MGHYKTDVRDVSLDGIDIGVLLAGLYNNALTGGMGLMHFDKDIMSPDEARHIFNEIKKRWVYGVREQWKINHQLRINYNQSEPDISKHYELLSLRDAFTFEAQRNADGINIEYINGRSIKTMFNWNSDGGTMLNFSRFWDYNHMPVAAVIELARKGISGQIRHGQYLDIQNEARILMQSASKKIIDWDDPENEVAADTKTFESRLSETEAQYIEGTQDRMNQDAMPVFAHRRREFYQISYFGGGVLQRGLGYPPVYPNPIPVYDPEQHKARPVRGFHSFARR